MLGRYSQQSLSMIKPLSLMRKPQCSKQISQWISPLRQRADSLVFSITSSKHHSPKDSILIVSEHSHPLSKELQTLQLKLQHLQSRVQRIDSENYTYNQGETPHPSHLFMNTQKFQSRIQQQNRDLNATAVGKIVTKINRQPKGNKTKTSKNQSYSKLHLDTQKRSNITTEESMVIQKAKQIQKLKTRVRNLKASVQKSQKSASLCSERLSASKKQVKCLKRQQAKRQKVITKLRGDLKRSEAIRQKQKEVIFKQQEEIKQLRLHLAACQSK